MTEIVTREILGIVQKSKWKSLKQLIKDLIHKTLNPDTGYILIALDVSIKNKKHPEFDYHIKNKEDIKKLNLINDFSQLSLYQYTDTTSNHVDLTQQDNIIIMIAKYLGPHLNHQKYFDFSVHLDALNPPYFTDGNQKIISCSEIIKLINYIHKETQPKKIEKNKKSVKKISKKDNGDIEALIFEKLEDKNANWAGTETKAFKNWKRRTANKYRKDKGKNPYYKGKPTKNFKEYLKKWLNNKKNNKIETKKKRENKHPRPKNQEKQITEEMAFEKLTGKKAIWAGNKTKGFMEWKEKIIKKYRKKTGKIPYYNGNLTKNFIIYINELIINKKEK